VVACVNRDEHSLAAKIRNSFNNTKQFIKKSETTSVLKTVLKTVTAKVFLDSLGIVPEKPYFCSTREKTIRKQTVTYGYLY